MLVIAGLALVLLWIALPAANAAKKTSLAGSGAGSGSAAFIAQAELASTGLGAEAYFGTSAAISADGNTAVVGAPGYQSGRGAAFVFTRSGATWSMQATLTASDEEAEGRLGQSVAISADGNTVIVGSNGYHHGGAWIFTRTGSIWTQQGPAIRPTMLVGEREVTEAGPQFGFSVAIAADGNTVLVGDPQTQSESLGEAWVFIRQGSTWVQQGGALIGGEYIGHLAEQGYAVSLSSDGSTALIGGPSTWGEPSSYYFQGASWVFTRSNGTWSQQGPKFTAGARSQYFGASVALTGDDTHALISGPAYSSQPGEGTGPAVWAFEESAGSWTHAQELKLSGEREFGLRLASSADGETALIEGGGSVWLYQTENGHWQLANDEPITVPTSEAPDSLALSATGETALVGEQAARGGQGSATVYQYVPNGPLPSISKLSTRKGSPAGGAEVLISGKNFVGVHAVRFGATRATAWKVTSEGTILATAPPSPSGVFDVTVKTVSGTSPATTKDEFTYTAPVVQTIAPNNGPTAGGTAVTIEGHGFAVGSTATVFAFGKVLVARRACPRPPALPTRQPREKAVPSKWLGA